MKRSKSDSKKRKLDLTEETQLEKNGKKAITHQSNQKEQQLWIDKYAPVSTMELAIHKKKVIQVKDWLEMAYSKRPQILVLTGPSGCGKTAVLKTLAMELGFNIREYANGAELQSFESSLANGWTEYTKTTAAFTEFIRSCVKSNSLQFSSNAVSNSKAVTTRSVLRWLTKIALVEDLPNIANRPVRDAVHSAIRSYSQAQRVVSPLVFIVSEQNIVAENGNYTDSISIRSLIPSEILNTNVCSEIKLNAVAKTILAKALTRISQLELRGTKGILSKDTINEIAANAEGDIRSAIYNLQFGGTKAKSSDSLLNCKKEVQMSLFQGVGKVLYNKRLDYIAAEEDQLIEELGYLKKPKMAFDPQNIVESVQVSDQMLLVYLQENHAHHCSTQDELLGADFFSQADVFMSNWEYSLFASQYATQLAIRGAMFFWDCNSKKPGTFNPLTKAKYWENETKRKENRSQWISCNLNELTQDCEQLSRHCINRGTFLDIVPYSNLILNSKSTNLQLESRSQDLIQSLCQYRKDVSGFKVDTTFEPEFSAFAAPKKLSKMECPSDAIQFLNELKRTAEYDQLVLLDDEIED